MSSCVEVRFDLRRGGFRLNVTLELPAEGVTGVVGASGSGKTTLLRTIAGLEPCPGGFLKVGETVWQDGDRNLAVHERPIGFVFQEASLFDHLSVQSNLEYGFTRVPAAERRVSFEEAVSLLGVQALLSRSPNRLSGGERQRVAMARAVVKSPRLLLMDEPLSALDPEGRKEVLPYLEKLSRSLEIPMIYVSHAAEEVARLADHLVLMEDGAARASGPISEVLTRVDLPLARGDDAASVLKAQVEGHELDYGLTQLRFAGGEFLVAYRDLPVGEPVRVRIAARDVSLTLAPQESTSILNILETVVDEVSGENEMRVTVRLDVSGQPLLARVTRKSADALKLERGVKVFAQVKSVALL